MTARTGYVIESEPQGPAYEGLIRVAPRFGQTAILVIRHWHDPVRKQNEQTMAEIAEFIISVEESAEWPGTQLIGHTATVYTFQLAPLVIEWLLTKARRLYEWECPALPEDLCFFAADGEPWLTTISHESVGALDLTDEQREQILNDVPGLIISPEASS